jgi:hypothetical protein
MVQGESDRGKWCNAFKGLRVYRKNEKFDAGYAFSSPAPLASMGHPRTPAPRGAAHPLAHCAQVAQCINRIPYPLAQRIGVHRVQWRSVYAGAGATR